MSLLNLTFFEEKLSNLSQEGNEKECRNLPKVELKEHRALNSIKVQVTELGGKGEKK